MDAGDRTTSRRAVLRAAGTAGTGVTGLAGPAAARQDDDGGNGGEMGNGWSARVPRQVQVTTRNLGLGARLYGFVDTDTRQVEPRQVYDRYQQVRSSAPGTRMRAIADDIAADLPAVVGLQEVARIRRGPPDYTGGSTPNADEAVYDFLDLFRTGLADALAASDIDVGYEVAAVVENVDEEFPAEGPDGERFDVRLTDRDVVLVRDDLDVLGTDTGNYSIAVRTALEDGTRIAVDRGYAQARVELAGAPFTFLTTHLESVAESIRVGQATELAGVVRGIDGPVIVAGDLNTTPDGDQSAAYRRLVGGRAGLTDAWAATRDDAGPTCCQNATLRNEQSGLGIRVDMVLTGGAATPFAIRRTDTDPTDRVLATTPEGQARLWPSDHAGVVADVLVEPTTRDPWPVLRGLLFGG